MHIQGKKELFTLVSRERHVVLSWDCFPCPKIYLKKVFFCCVVEAVPTLANFIF